MFQSVSHHWETVHHSSPLAYVSIGPVNEGFAAISFAA